MTVLDLINNTTNSNTSNNNNNNINNSNSNTTSSTSKLANNNSNTKIEVDSSSTTSTTLLNINHHQNYLASPVPSTPPQSPIPPITTSTNCESSITISPNNSSSSSTSSLLVSSILNNNKIKHQNLLIPKSTNMILENNNNNNTNQQSNMDDVTKTATKLIDDKHSSIEKTPSSSNEEEDDVDDDEEEEEEELAIINEDDEMMPLMPIIHTPPQSAASSISSHNLIDSSKSNITKMIDSLIEQEVVIVDSPKTINTDSEAIKAQKFLDLKSKLKNINILKSSVQKNHDLLRDNLKLSYKRLRLNETTCFQTHVKEQLENILELKKRQEESSLSNTNSTTIIDEKSVDLLTSILKSNLKNTNNPNVNNNLNNNNNSSNSNNILNSLVDDIQYELSKQKEDKLSEDDTDSSDDDLDVDSNNEHVNSVLNGDNININNYNSKSNIYWQMRRIKLGSEWERVQAKMRNLKLKNKQCNKYLNSIIQNKHDDHQNNNKNNENKEEEAIAALSNSLQESVASVIFNNSNSSNESSCKDIHDDNDGDSTTTSQRCITKTKNQLISNDLITFNDPILRSFYLTLAHFNSNLFKTMCWCDLNSDQSTITNTKASFKRKFNQESKSEKKTCIFCHLFKAYEKNRIYNSNLKQNLFKLSLEASQTSKVKANDDLVKLDHSYCKQQPITKQIINNNNDKENNNNINLNNIDKKLKMIKMMDYNKDFDDGLLDRVNERLNRLFDSSNCCGTSSMVGNSNTSTTTTTSCKKKQFKSVFLDDDFDLFDDQIKQDLSFVDVGFDLSSDDIKKLPNLSYDEYVLLSNK